MADVEAISIGSVSFWSYASINEGDQYLLANFAATAWFSLSEDQKGQLLVTATRLFDRQCWVGEKTDPDQPTQWPRSGVTDAAGEEIDSSIVPDEVMYATIEMAFAILEGSEAVNSSVPGAQKLRSIAAGSVSLSWFRGAEGNNARYDRFPLPVQELIGQWLCAGQTVAGLIVSGTGGVSVTDEDLGYNEGV